MESVIETRLNPALAEMYRDVLEKEGFEVYVREENENEWQDIKDLVLIHEGEDDLRRARELLGAIEPRPEGAGGEAAREDLGVADEGPA